MEIEDMNQWINRVRAAFLLAWAVGAMAAAHADQTVAAHSQYFKDWTFYSSSVNGTGYTSITGQLGPIPLTVRTTDGHSIVRQNWSSDYLGMYPLAKLPDDIGLPTAARVPLFEHLANRAANPSLLEIATSNGQPLPIGTVLFLHDVDGGDHAQLRFFGCNGAQLDASSSEWLKIAVTDPLPQTAEFQSTGSDNFWLVTDPRTGGSPNDNTTFGLMIHRGGVCSIRVSTEPGHSTIDMFLGISNAALQEALAPKPVPTLNGAGGLVLTGLMVLGFAVLRRRG